MAAGVKERQGALWEDSFEGGGGGRRKSEKDWGRGGGGRRGDGREAGDQVGVDEERGEMDDVLVFLRGRPGSGGEGECEGEEDWS